MTRNISLASRLREVLLNGHWIANTNYKEQLQHVTWQQATQKVDDFKHYCGINVSHQLLLKRTVGCF
jgi:hypothetical protein